MSNAKFHAFARESVDLAGFAKALAHPARICILQFLAHRGEVPCMEIVANLPLSQPTCSRHINELRKAGLLRSRQEGNRVLFRLDQLALERFCRNMNEALHPAQSPSNSPSDSH